MQKDITGEKFNRLVAVKSINRIDNKYYWLFRCDCGKEKILWKAAVTSGIVKSCGCLLSETTKKRFTKHGMYKTRFYKIWENIKSRCLNKNCSSYFKYGLRGIEICEEWTKFENFKNDMYQEYINHVNKFGDTKTSIDRIDNNLGYNKINCRWATPKIQSCNRRNVNLITYNNKTQTAKDWSLELGFSKGVIAHRIKNMKWSIEKSITKPLLR